MDKKKVEELIEQAIIWSRYANQHSVISNLEEALKELNKPDSKAKAKYRPFANAEECWNEMQKHQPFGWVKDNETQSFFVCKAFGNLLFSIGIEDKPYNYNEVLRDYTFADGTPFGIKVEG